MSQEVIKAIDMALLALPAKMESDQARLMMLTIQKQEDPEERRYQLVKRTPKTLPANIVNDKWAKGPARGLWQFEQGGGARGVLEHQSTKSLAVDICNRYGVLPSPGACWRALEGNDEFAACFARMLLWTDAGALPEANDVEAAMALYLRTWRPGAYTNGSETQKRELIDKFRRNHSAALLELGI